MSITIRNHTSNDLPQLAAFITRYLGSIPDAKLIAPEVYIVNEEWLLGLYVR